MKKKILYLIMFSVLIFNCRNKSQNDNFKYSKITNDLLNNNNHIENKANLYLIEDSEIIKLKLNKSRNIISQLGESFEHIGCDSKKVNEYFESSYFEIEEIFNSPSAKVYFKEIKNEVFLINNDQECILKKIRMLIILTNLRESLCN